MNKQKYYDPFAAVKRSKTSVPEKNLFSEQVTTTSFLIRRDNNEKIVINKSPFVIGTKSEVCDYVITGNKYIGRNHAQIVIKDNEYIFIDNNSTNKSYINRAQVLPTQNQVLKNGDEIKLANLLFTIVIE